MLLHTVGLVLDIGLFRPHPMTAYLQIKFVNLKVCSINGEKLKGRIEQIAWMLECRSVDSQCGQEARFRGKCVKMIKVKAAQCKLSEWEMMRIWE